MLRAERSDDSLPFIRPRMSSLPSPSPVYRILFVCLGNICRSPAAEIICRDILQRCGVQAQVDSCGTASYHVGSRPDVRMLSALRRAGYEYAGHRARTLCSKDGELFDFIIPQDAENERDVLRIISPSAAARVLPMSRWFPAGCKYREVPDPYYGGDKDFDEVVALLTESMAALVRELFAVDYSPRSACRMDGGVSRSSSR